MESRRTRAVVELAILIGAFVLVRYAVVPDMAIAVALVVIAGIEAAYRWLL